jgi:hypothetical protein
MPPVVEHIPLFRRALYRTPGWRSARASSWDRETGAPPFFLDSGRETPYAGLLRHVSTTYGRPYLTRCAIGTRFAPVPTTLESSSFRFPPSIPAAFFEREDELPSGPLVPGPGGPA